jgi:hypothetical protein
MDFVKKITPSSWFAIVIIAIIANTLITIGLYPSQKPDYWWLPGAWILFLLNDKVWKPIRNRIWPPPFDPKDPNKRLKRTFAPPRIA